MKKLLFASVISLLVIACNSKEEKKEDDASKKMADMKALYEKNLATVKTFIADFEKEDAAGLAAQVADTAKWSSPAYGDTVSTKAHWMGSLKYYLDNWDSLKLNNSYFLPGVDQNTQELDGSVRYYGDWAGIHKSGLATSVKFYGTYDFNSDNKIISGADYFDLGGLMNAVASKSKK